MRSEPAVKETSMMENERFPEEEEIDLRDYLNVVIKRKWMVITFLLVVVTMVAIYTLRMKPVYRATARLLIERESPKIVSVEEVMVLDTANQDYYQTQYKIMASRSLAERVIKKLGLGKTKEFNPPAQGFNIQAAIASTVHNVLSSLNTNRVSKEEHGTGETVSSLIKGWRDLYLSRIEVTPIRNSRLVDISFEGHDPKLVAAVINTHAELYIESDMEMKWEASRHALKWLNSSLEDLKKKLEQSEKILYGFMEKEDIVSLENILGTHEAAGQNIIAQKLSELNTTATKAKTDRISYEILYKELQNLSKEPGMIESFPNIIDNSLIQNLKTEYIRLLREFSDLDKEYGEKHPKMIRLRSEMNEMKGRIAQEIQKIAKSVETRYKMARAREESLLKTLQNQKGEVMKLNKKAIQYAALKREVEGNRQMYDLVLRRAKETSLTTGLKSSNIRIIDLADVPTGPVKPRVRLNILLALITGLTMGIGIAFFFEYLDNTLKTPDDIKQYLRVPFLGLVGHFKVSGDGSRKNELIVLGEPKSNISEALRNIRTNIIFASSGLDKKSILITSAVPGEGKTLICSNLAIVMAQMGKKVLLIDADMRKPRIHKLFNLEKDFGITDLLVGNRVKKKTIFEDSPLKNLKIITSGTVPPNPSELLGSQRMKTLIAKMKERFDIILFDSPPVVSVTDPAVLSTIVDGVVLVAKAGATGKDVVQKSLDQLSEVGVKVLGVVLNDVDFKRERYYHNYSKYYHYYDDEGEKKKKRGKRQKSRRKAEEEIPQEKHVA